MGDDVGAWDTMRPKSAHNPVRIERRKEKKETKNPQDKKRGNVERKWQKGKGTKGTKGTTRGEKTTGKQGNNETRKRPQQLYDLHPRQGEGDFSYEKEIKKKDWAARA